MEVLAMPGTISLAARYLGGGQAHTEELALAMPRTALLLVDVYYDDQRRGDWGDPLNPFVPHFQWMEGNIAVALEAARKVQMTVVYAMNSAPRIALERSAFGAHFARAWSEDGSPESFDREFAEGGVDPREYHGGPDTPLKIPESLAPKAGELYIRKHVYSAFFDSRLDTALRNLGVDTLICAGLWANVCMAATALDALYRNYRVLWLRDGTLAGEKPEEVEELTNTARWLEWFEEVVGYTVDSTEFALGCNQA
jgi:nicotinamidase-related amidase